MFALLANPAARPVLSSQDHALLALISERNFNLTLVISHAPDAHPAQQSHLTLTRWLKLPHIDTVVRELIADLARYSTYTAQLLHNASILTLNTVVERASHNLALLEECATHQPQHTRAVEEYRLAAQALYRATRPNQPPRTPTSPRPPRSSTSTSHSSRSSGSASTSSSSASPSSSSYSSHSSSSDTSSSPSCSSSSVPESASFKSDISNLKSPSSASLSATPPLCHSATSCSSHSPDPSSHHCESASHSATPPLCHSATSFSCHSTNPSPNHAASLTFNFQLSSFNSPPDTFNSHPP